MSIKIHPSIGVARLGNSPDGKLLVPNKIGGLPHEYNPKNLDEYDTINQNDLPPVNFKDELGRIKRQGQPFRVYDEHGEIYLGRKVKGKEDIASIEWTVHLANKKAEWYEYHELQGNLLYPDNSYESNAKRYEPVIDKKDKIKRDEYPLRNRDIGIAKSSERQKLILDPGLRTLIVKKDGPKADIAYFTKNAKAFDKSTAKDEDYLATGKFGNSIETLGEIHVDKKGRLVVFGGHGNTCGNEELTGYGGGDTWHDDISDGSITCKVTFTNKKLNNDINNIAKAWCIVGSPDFAPEIVNISTLYDTMLDLGIRSFGTQLKGAKTSGRPNNNRAIILENGKYNDNYIAIYERDIHPIFERMSRYQWVGNVQAMVNFGLFTSDHKINVNELSCKKEKESILKHRKKIYDYFREIDDKYEFNNGFDLEDTQKYYLKSTYDDVDHLENDKLMREKYSQEEHPQEYLFKDQNDYFTTKKVTIEKIIEIPGEQERKEKVEENVENVEFGNIYPLMPLNAGSGAPRNENPLKFVSLTATQLFLLKQWSKGYCVSRPDYKPENDPHYKDSISIGNCIGLPMSPGIEVTWTVHNPVIYESAFNIKHAVLNNNSLTLTRDECEPTLDKENNIGEGCEPGDLTKRMACPWQADFLNCSIQTINFSNPAQNRHYIVDDKDYKDPKTDSPSINRSFPAPLYYAHWWPAQSPWEVIVGDFTSKRQIANGGFEAGRQMNYQRGINTYNEMINFWDTLGFIRDINYKNSGFPYIVETERNHDFFSGDKLNLKDIYLKDKFYLKENLDELKKYIKPELFSGLDINHLTEVDYRNKIKELLDKYELEVVIPVFYLDYDKAKKAREEQKKATSEILIKQVGEENSYKEYKKKLIESIKSNSLKNLGSDSRR